MNIFKFLKGSRKSEKIVTVVVASAVVILLLVLFGSCWGIFHNDLSRAAQTATAGDHTLGTILLGAAILWFVLNASDKIPFQVNDALVGVVTILLLILSVNAYCGWFIGVY